MKLFGITIGRKPEETPAEEVHNYGKVAKPKASVYTPGGGGVQGAQGYVYAIYDGEKNLGEMGPPKVYIKDYMTLRIRSKQLYLESDIIFIGINRYIEWVIGKGLSVKVEPQLEVLQRKGIKIDTEAFNRNFESLWRIYSNSKLADYAGQKTLVELESEGIREAKTTGDILVVLRVIGNIVKVQHIDAINVGNPPNCHMEYMNQVTAAGINGYEYVYNPTGNRIRMGVEIDATGNHVAYHVRKGISLEYERIAAKDSKGFIRAYLYYGPKTNVNEDRGTSLVSVIMEKAKVMDRYISANLTAEEERAKIPYFFEHGGNSDNENPLGGRQMRALISNRNPADAVNTDIGIDDLGEKVAAETAVSTNKTVINLPNDVRIKAIDSRAASQFKDFVEANLDIAFAAIGIPPNVAMRKYDDSFSASRMAGEDWQHTFLTERVNFGSGYLDPIRKLQTYVWVLTGEVEAPGLLEAIQEKNSLVVEAYMFARYTGDMFPDIDPLKTVNYLRKALGTAFDHVPLITPENAAEVIETGEIGAIIKQSGEELKRTAEAGIEPKQTVQQEKEEPTKEEEGEGTEF